MAYILLSDADFNLILEQEFDRVTLKDQTSAPSPGANQVDLYVQNQSGRSMLWAVDDSGVGIRLGHDSVMVVRNATGSGMTKGQLVTFTGSTGNVPNVALAQANDPDTLADYVLMEDIANGGFGYAAHICMLTINTVGLNEGDFVYLDAATPGAYTTTEPTPAAAVYPQHVGVVTKVAAAGVIHFEIESHAHPEHIWHGNLAGLTGDDHTQYLLVDGTRAMTGGLETMGSPAQTDHSINIGDSGENWTTSNWGKGAFMANACVLRWPVTGGRSWGIGQSSDILYIMSSTKDDASAAVSYVTKFDVTASPVTAPTIQMVGRLHVGSSTVGNTNTKQSVGLTIEQTTYDDEILSLKSGDVTHGVTDVTETDTYGFFSKYSGSIGGLKIAGLTESVVSCSIYGYATSADQTKNAEGQGNLYINLMKKSAAGGAAHSANENLIAVTSGSDGTVWILDADGDTWQSGDITAVNITASAALAAESCTINYPRFMAPSGEALQVLFDADALEDDADRWMLEVADGGNFSLQSYATGSFVARLYLTPGGILLVGDDSNAQMTQGITINQGAADNEILAFKSSDVAHGVTSQAETDTYAFFRKNEAAGCLRIQGFATNETGIILIPVSVNDNTTKSSAGKSPLRINVVKKSGTSIGAVGSDANLVNIENNGSTVWIVDEDGDTWQSGDITAVNATLSGQLNIESILAVDGDGLLLKDDAGNLGIKIADGGEPQGRTANPIPEVVQSASEPGTMHPGMIWIDTDADGGQCSTILLDADGDTKVDVEESADEDIVRIDAGGNQVALWRADGSFQFEDCPRVRLEGITTAQDNLSTGGLHVVKFDEYEDPGSDYNTTTWTYTAPQDGYYFIFANIMLTNSDADCLEIYLQLTTSNKTYQFVESGNQWDADPTYWNPSCTWIAFMDQNDTATIGVIFGSGCAAQTDIFDSGLTQCEIRLLG